MAIISTETEILDKVAHSYFEQIEIVGKFLKVWYLTPNNALRSINCKKYYDSVSNDQYYLVNIPDKNYIINFFVDGYGFPTFAEWFRISFSDSERINFYSNQTLLEYVEDEDYRNEYTPIVIFNDYLL